MTLANGDEIGDVLSTLIENNSRQLVLQRGKQGFGFVLRGSRSKSGDTAMNNNSSFAYFQVPGKFFRPSVCFPALQFIESIEKGSNADRAGLKPNHFLLQVNSFRSFSSCLIFGEKLFLDKWHKCCVHVARTMCPVNQTNWSNIDIESYRRSNIISM